MKKTLLPLCLCFALPVFAKPQLELLWETSGLRVPESVLIYQQNDNKLLFVSEIDGKGNVADGEGGVAILSTDGQMREHNWVRGLNAPKGLGVYQGKLYVADLTEVVIIDIATGKVVEKVVAPDAVFLNDITINADGVLYVSDTRKNRIYKLENGQISVWLENVDRPNGLKIIEDTLYIGAAHSLLKADSSGSLSEVASGFEQVTDGVEPLANGDFIVTCWAGIVYYVHADGRIVKMLDTQQQKINTADIGWDSSSNTLYVPTFFGNSVKAFRLVTD